MNNYAVFCDESGQQMPPEKDGLYMVIGGVVLIDDSQLPIIKKEIEDIKKKHDFVGELKFTNFYTEALDKKYGKNTLFGSEGKKILDLYVDIFDNIFIKYNIDFRACIFDKRELRHGEFSPPGAPENHYNHYGLFTLYKVFLYNQIVKNIDGASYKLYLDQFGSKPKKFNFSIFDFKKKIEKKLSIKGRVAYISDMQFSLSKDENLIQLADIICGAISFSANNKSTDNPDKNKFIEHIKDGVNKKHKLNISALSQDTGWEFRWKIWRVDMNEGYKQTI